MARKQLFWLHVKKSAGITTRALLRPHYVEVDRVRKPKNFIQATPDEYNDILNNYRVVLGEYQFRRCLFAKKYLYPDTWDDLFSFAFSREPTDRCVSMFYYLFWKHHGRFGALARSCRGFVATRKLMLSTAYAFDVFLDYVRDARASDSIYRPIGIHFTTHTAPMWDDITDENGRLLLKQVFRLEKLTEGINLVFEQCGIPVTTAHGARDLNRNTDRRAYRPSRQQQAKIEQIYDRDFDVYENAWR
ncbi:MAG: sulfotransferase family 2 domain-containing protein [Gammaproteobacteria bacterium]